MLNFIYYCTNYKQCLIQIEELNRTFVSQVEGLRTYDCSSKQQKVDQGAQDELESSNEQQELKG
jgi:hypothetical protein